MSIFVFAVINVIFACFMLLLSVKSCAKNEYLAIFRFGRCLGITSGAIVIILPLIDRIVRIKQGDQGVLVDSETIDIKGFLIPIITENNIPTGSKVKVIGSENVPDSRQFRKGCKLKVIRDIV